MKRTSLFLTTLLATIAMSATAFAGDKSFSDLDTDGDGNLSQQELQEAGKDVEVSELDKDNDGAVSEEEYKEAKEKMKERKQ